MSPPVGAAGSASGVPGVTGVKVKGWCLTWMSGCMSASLMIVKMIGVQV